VDATGVDAWEALLWEWTEDDGLPDYHLMEKYSTDVLGHVGEAYYLVVYTWRGEHRRLISAWKVGVHGKRRYQMILTRGMAGEA
jgi:hypothetical protein